MTLSLPNTGEAIITDLGEADDIHPRNKRDVGKRLARLALVQDYGYKIVSRSPRYLSHTIKDGKVTIKFQDVGDGLDTFDVREPVGLTIAGEDKKFVPAQGKILSNDTLLVWSDQVKDPVSVRYAWADNPVCNLQNRTALPVTPFRTDDWPGVTINAN
jgi:sialate O-acetylesterase